MNTKLVLCVVLLSVEDNLAAHLHLMRNLGKISDMTLHPLGGFYFYLGIIIFLYHVLSGFLSPLVACRLRTGKA